MSNDRNYITEASNLVGKTRLAQDNALIALGRLSLVPHADMLAVSAAVRTAREAVSAYEKAQADFDAIIAKEFPNK
jgi:hypothetical protein